jgi:GNAT superfamily N-acetyltransferase
VATGAAYFTGPAAWIDFASTLPEARGRGAQSALIARRIEDCARARCDTIVVETAEPTAENAAPSYRNVTRLGFQPVYARPNYLYVFE